MKQANDVFTIMIALGIADIIFKAFDIKRADDYPTMFICLGIVVAGMVICNVANYSYKIYRVKRSS
jgi:hypothetical protein